MPTVPGGTILLPIATATAAVCKPELLSKEDLFLLYAEFFFSYDINPAGFGHLYGVYDQAAGETASMCLGIEDRQALMGKLWLTYERMSATLRYYPLPTYINGERHTLNRSSALHLRKGFVNGVAQRACTAVAMATLLVEDGDGMWSVQVTMPSSTSIHDLVVYQSGVRSQRVPIASRSLSGDTATLRFYHETLVSAVYWAECGASRTPCDCAVILSDAAAFMTEVDVYALKPVSNSGLDLTVNSTCAPGSTTMCGAVEDPVLGWVRGMGSAWSCTASPAAAVYGTAYYTSGRWDRDTIPADVQEALFGTAISLMPDTGLCMEATRPLHFAQYRELAPTDAPGGMRPWGQVLMRAVTRSYANGSGI